MKAWPEKPVLSPRCALGDRAAAPGLPRALASPRVHISTCAHRPTDLLRTTFPCPHLPSQRVSSMLHPGVVLLPTPPSVAPAFSLLSSGQCLESTPSLPALPALRMPRQVSPPCLCSRGPRLWPPLKAWMRLGELPVQGWPAPCTHNAHHRVPGVSASHHG